jgi:hypothetical protein
LLWNLLLDSAREQHASGLGHQLLLLLSGVILVQDTLQEWTAGNLVASDQWREIVCSGGVESAVCIDSSNGMRDVGAGLTRSRRGLLSSRISGSLVRLLPAVVQVLRLLLRA